MHPAKLPQRMLLACLAFGLAALASGPGLAESRQAEPLALRKIMQDLGKDMEEVTRGISREDWALVAKVAPRIAKHPQPPVGEKVKILAYLGSDAGNFRGHDEAVHRHAQELEKAAAAKDGRAAIAAFANVQASCLACHQAYRTAFVEHFYGKR